MKSILILVISVLGLIPALLPAAEANPGPSTQIAPVVNVPDIQVEATVSQVVDELWAKVDATYTMSTLYAYGDALLTPNYGMGLLSNPSDYVAVTVAYDALDAYYPIPLNATNISFKMDGSELNWTTRQQVFHLFGTDLPEVEWRIQHIPRNFLVTAHYEFPIQRTGETYGYLGEYGFVFPLGARYDLKEIPDYGYTGYPWFGNSAAHFSIKIDTSLNNSSTFSIDGFGALKPMTSSFSREGGMAKIEFTVSGSNASDYTTTNSYGIVTILNTSESVSEPFTMLTLLAGISVAVAIFVAVAVIYLKGHQKTSGVGVVKNL